MQFATTSDGLEIAYAVGGNGFPLLKMPGGIGGLGGIQLRDYPVQNEMAEAFECRFRLIEYEQRGQGRSSHGISSYTLDDAQADLNSVTTALELLRFLILTASPGANLAIRIAALQPERVAGLILWDPWPLAGFDWSKADRLAETMRVHIELVDKACYLATRNFAAVEFPPPRHPLELEDSLVALRDNRLADVRDLVPRAQAPMLLLQTPYSDHTEAERDLVAEQLPAAHRVRLPHPIPGPYDQNLGPALRAIEHFLRVCVPDATGGLDQAPSYSANRQWPHEDGPAGNGRSNPELAELSSREREIIGLLAHGCSNAEIAGALTLSPGTVARHVANAYSKLGIHNRAQATALYLGAHPRS